MKKITSDDLISIDENFRVSAGPGAGKTYWLVNHINSVLSTSPHIVGLKKIACITYTNIGVETIQNRVEDNISVEVSTIHSFLYNNIVKPYSCFCKEEYFVDSTKIDGHDEPSIHKGVLKDWLENHSNRNLLKPPFSFNQLLKLNHNFMAVGKWLSSMNAKILEDGNITFVCDNKKAVHYYIKNDKKERSQINSKTLKILEKDIMKYKKHLWKEGILEHEDILYLSYRLIQDNPFILQVLRSNYPYFFIDEYQDTNPIQSKLLKLIADDNIVIGVIGDEAQSIYGFQGADLSLFKKNVAENTVDYFIKDNRRSTHNIVKCLNLIRPELNQNNIREEVGNIPKILVGDKKEALNKLSIEFGNDNIQTLSRDNIMSNIMKRTDGVFDYEKNIVDLIYSIDNPGKGNGYRSLNVIRCLKSVELARQKKYKEAIHEMKKVYKRNHDGSDANINATNAVKFLLNNYACYEQGKLIDFVNILRTNICSDISNLRSGKPKKMYDETDYKQVAVCINITEDVSLSKTIHKSKGDEYDNVLVILDREKKLDCLFETDLLHNEEHRVYYVAMSRARDNLFINVPTLSVDNRSKLSGKFTILDL